MFLLQPRATVCRYLLARHLLLARGCNFHPQALRRSQAPLRHHATTRRTIPLSGTCCHIVPRAPFPQTRGALGATRATPAGSRCCTAGRAVWSNTDMQRSAAAFLPACSCPPQLSLTRDGSRPSLALLPKNLAISPWKNPILAGDLPPTKAVFATEKSPAG